MRTRRTVAGLVLALVVVGLAACGSTSSRSVQVTLSSTGVHPSQTSFQAGIPYHFVVTNRSTAPQTFLLMPQGMSGMPMGEMQQRAIVWMHEITPGATVSADYTFPMAMAHQSFEFGCYSADHAVMWQTAQVQ